VEVLYVSGNQCVPMNGCVYVVVFVYETEEGLFNN
jgi:hypothetical protein